MQPKNFAKSPAPASPGARPLLAAVVYAVAVLLVPVTARAETNAHAPSHYTAAAFSAPLDWHYVSALDPAYWEAVYSVSAGVSHRYYPTDGVGLAVELSYLHPWARVVGAEGASATTGRVDHTAWSGFRAGGAASGRWFFDSASLEDIALFFHFDGGAQLAYYNREADNIFGERSFQSRRLGISVTARPGLVLEVHDSLFFGVDVLLGASLVNRETVARRYLEDIAYNSFLRGVFVAPGFSAGVSY